MILLIIAISLVTVFSSLCSLVEAALFAIPKNRVSAWLLKDKNNKSIKSLYTIKSSMQRPIASIVILNNVSNIGGSMVIGGIIGNMFNELWIGIASGVFTLYVIIFSEIIPKTLGEKYADIVSVKSARAINVITEILTPILILISFFTRPFNKGPRDTKITEEEIKVLANLGKEQGVLEKHEEELIQKALRLNDIKVRDIMTPRISMIRIDGQLTLKEAKKTILNEQYSRIPIYKKNIDTVEGLLYKSDALRAIISGDLDIKLSSLSREVLFVPENKTIDKLMEKLRITQTHTAIVVDEYGGTAGLVTLEDILEELVGDIASEDGKDTDDEAKEIVEVVKERDEIIVTGRITIDELIKYFEMELKLDYPKHSTISKVLLEKLKRFPRDGEEIKLGRFLCKVEELSAKRIEKVRLKSVSGAHKRVGKKEDDGQKQVGEGGKEGRRGRKGRREGKER